MDTKRIITAVAAALVIGVVAGNVVSGWAAAPTSGSSGRSATVNPTARLGLRLGSAMQAEGARLADVVAKLTGIPVTDVTAKRTAGTSYAQIAATKDVSSAAIVAESLKIRQALLADRVKAGSITATQADAALANMKTRLTERVSATDASCVGTGGGRGAGAGRGNGLGCGTGSGSCGGAGCANTAPATQ